MSENKIANGLKYIFEKDSLKVKIIVAIGLIGIVLIFASDFLVKSDIQNVKEQENINYTEYVSNLEKKLTDVISSIDGVGNCKVMITLENSSENVFATDTEKKNDDSSVNTKDQYVIYDSEKGETPVLIKEYFPKVQGVTVVCSGGDNKIVREKVINSVSSLFNITANRISVSKIKS